MGFVWDGYGFPFFSHALALPEAFQQRKAGTQLDCASSELVLYDIAVKHPKVFGHKHVLRNMFGWTVLPIESKLGAGRKCSAT